MHPIKSFGIFKQIQNCVINSNLINVIKARYGM